MENRMLKILAIDDNPDNLFSLKALVLDTFPNAIIYTADDGNNGLTIALAEDPDLILLDILMPGMDGFEVCQKIKADKKMCDIPVIFVTSLTDDSENRIKALECGAEAFLSKPIDPTELTAQIKAMTKIKNANIDKRYEKERLEHLISQRTLQLQAELTERKNAEKSLMLSEQNLADIFETVTEGIAYTDIKGKILAINGSFCRIIGIHKDEITGRNIFELARSLLSYKEISVVLPLLKKLLTGKTIHPFQVNYKDKTLEISANVNLSTKRMTLVIRDITDNKRAEEALHAEQLFSKSIIDSLPGIFYIYSYPELKLTLWNKNHETLFGYHSEEMTDKDLFDWHLPENRTHVLEAVENVMKEDFNSMESPLLHKDGYSIPYLITGVPFESNGKNYLMGFGVDISDRIKAEEALRESEARFRAIIDTIPMAIHLSFDIEQTTKYINPAMVKMFGYTQEDLPSVAEWWPLAYPDEDYRRKISEEWTQKVIRAIETQSPIEPMEVICTCKDGTKKIILWNYITMGGLNYSLGLDITEQKIAQDKQKESEDKYRLLVENQNDLVVKIDKNGSFQYVSPSYCKVFGKEESELIGNSFFPLVHEDDIESTRKEMEKLYHAPHCCTVVQRAMTKDGWRWYSWSDKAELDENNEIVSIIGVGRDITEQKLAEAEIRKLNAELENMVEVRTAQLLNTNKELESFAYTVSHDLRAPIRGINSFTNILLDEYTASLDDEGKRICNIIQDTSVKMGRLIDNLLEFSRIHRNSLKLKTIDMKHMVIEVFKEIISQEKSHRIDFVVEELDQIIADQVLIRQVWVNLISNAVKFSSKTDNPAIKITSEKEGEKVIYTIKDNGAGFDMKYASKLFGVFERLHTEKEYPGTGAGLAIVQRIIHRHGGEIRAEGEVGKGALFSFSLPIEQKQIIKKEPII
jgi:PAS domain S-box-containing protein